MSSVRGTEYKSLQTPEKARPAGGADHLRPMDTSGHWLGLGSDLDRIPNEMIEMQNLNGILIHNEGMILGGELYKNNTFTGLV